MFHVWDHFDYTGNKTWFQQQGWPLLKVCYAAVLLSPLVLPLGQGVAQFHLDKLIPDLHFNDSTLVTAPCNSPEQVPITFGKEVHAIRWLAALTVLCRLCTRSTGHLAIIQRHRERLRSVRRYGHDLPRRSVIMRTRF